jgi:hypothetical protein
MFCSVGSSMSRRPSPRKLAPAAVIMMASPGKVAIHHASRKVVAAVGEHIAPGGRGRLDAEAEKAERRLEDDHARHLEGAEHQRGAHDSGQEMPPQDALVPRPEPARGLHELLIAQHEHHAAGGARVHRPGGHREHDDDVPERRPQQGHDREREQDEREGELQVDAAHDHGVEPAAVVAGEQPERDAEQSRGKDRGQAHRERDPRAVDDPAQDVAAQVIRAEPERGAAARVHEARRLEPDQDLLGRRRAGRDAVGEKRQHAHRGHDDEADHGEAMAGEPPPPLPGTGRRGRRRGQLSPLDHGRRAHAHSTAWTRGSR